MGFLADPLGALLAFIYELVPNYGVAIIILTLLINLAMFPLTLKQTRSMKAMQEIQPEVKKLQKELKGDREELNKALMELYQERGVNPLSGCLPLIIQLPIWFALFRVLQDNRGIPADSSLADALAAGHNTFLGLDLGTSPQSAVEFGFPDLVPYIVLMLVVAVTAFFQMRQTTQQRASAGGAATQQQQTMQNVLKFMPFMIVIFTFLWPTGLGLYFTTSNIFRIGQTAYIYRSDGDDGEVGAKPSKEGPDGGTETPPRSGPSPHSSKKRKQRRRK